MAVDLVQLEIDLRKIQALSAEILNIVSHARLGKMIVSTIEIPFSQANKDALVARYQVLKSDLSIKVGALP